MTLLQRYRSLPRSGRWLIVLGLFVVAYFVAIEPVVEKTAALNADADRLASSLRDKAQSRARVSEAAGQVEQLAGLFGQPALPAGSVERLGALQKRVNAIFAEHRVANQKTMQKDPTPLAGEAPASLANEREKLERLAVEVTFETDIPTLMAVLTKLEQAPEVCAVTKLTVRKIAPPGRSRERDGPVQVNVTAETWAVAAAATGRPGRAPGRQP